MANTGLTIVRSELILGGQKSGKSRRAELLARDWLAQSTTHRAVFVATAQPGDEEMRMRIARHQVDRAARVPGMATVEEPLALAEKINELSRADTLLVVDCLTLWLTNWLMPATPVVQSQGVTTNRICEPTAMLLDAIAKAPGPLVLVGNEIGMGVIPMGAEVRSFVDALGQLNQQAAQKCQRVTLMAAGLALTLKDDA